MEKDNNNQNKDDINNNNYNSNTKNTRNFINMIANQSYNLNNNKNNFSQLEPSNNDFTLKNYQDDSFNKVYNNNYYNNYNNIEHPSTLDRNNIMTNNGINDQNYDNNYINSFNKSINTDINNSNNNNINYYHNLYMNQMNKEINNPEKIAKNKGTQKRNNYIPKNLIINPQNVNQNNQNTSKKLGVQDYYSNLYNNYYNNILSQEHKNSFDSQNINQRKNSNNFINSPTHDIDNNFSNIINDINSNENEENNHDICKAFTYIFDSNIKDVKEIMTDDNFFNNSCPQSIIDNANFRINNCSDKEGNIISLRWKKFYTLELMCTKAFSNKTSIYFTFTLINLKPVNTSNMQLEPK